jgi:hypothetical protein
VRRFGIASLVAAGLLVAGCSAPQPPEVTFFAAGKTVRLSPYSLCKGEMTGACPQTPQAQGQLKVPGGKPLNISVPSEVADAPWVVVYTYRGSDGTEKPDRSPIFRAGESYAFTLNLPTAGDQLTQVEVQRITAIAPGGEQQMVFIADATWALQVTS